MNELLLYCLIIGLGGLVIGFFLGFLAATMSLAHNFRKDPDGMIEYFIKRRDRMLKTEEEIFDQNAKSLYLEKVGDTIMVYENDTDRFVTQGDTEIQAIRDAQDKFPGHVILFNVDRLYPELVGVDPKVIQEKIAEIYNQLD